MVCRPILVLGALAASLAAQPLTEAACAEVRDAVRPSPAELAWRAIPWRDTFGAAALEADEVRRPVLLWAMNGHPLGCV